MLQLNSMDVFVAIILFLFGTVLGSFLNVVILRYNTGYSVGGRSQCFSCGKTLRWYELVPLVSYIALRGKCSSCKSRISLQYPMVEALTGVIFLAIYAKLAVSLPFSPGLIAALGYYYAVFSLLIVIVVYDLRHTIIPDGMVYAFSLAALAGAFVDFEALAIVMPSYAHVAAGPLLFFPFFAMWYLSRGTWMGFGDAKLALGMGWFLGLAGGSMAVMVAFWIGAAVGVGLLLLKRFLSGERALRSRLGTLTIKSEIPFAPFLVLGTILVFLFEWGIDLWHF